MHSTPKSTSSTSPSSSGDGADATVADIGEIALVERVVEACGGPTAAGPHVAETLPIVGAGDDAAVIPAPDARVVVTTDMAVEGRHFRTDWSDPEDIGHRVAAANLADVAAMGARPTGLVVALALPGSTSVAWVRSLMSGIVEEAASVGSRVIGGDITAGDSIVISISALGDLAGREPVLRSGVEEGDVIAVAGRLGWAAAGLAVLGRGFRSPRALVDAYRRPAPPYAAARAAAEAGAHALMDISDGLLIDAQRMARASGVGISLDSAVLPVPEPLAAAASAYNLDPLQWILGGGDDHAFLAAFPPVSSLPEDFLVIGTAIPAEDSAQGVVLVDGRLPEVPAGFEHFRR